MVNTLLTYKARCELRAGMCYPQPHIPHYSSHSKFFFVSASGVCGGCSKDAYEHAIDKDNVQLLEILLQRQSSARLVGVSYWFYDYRWYVYLFLFYCIVMYCQKVILPLNHHRRYRYYSKNKNLKVCLKLKHAMIYM